MLPLHYVQQEVSLLGKALASETRRHGRLIRTRTVTAVQVIFSAMAVFISWRVHGVRLQAKSGVYVSGSFWLTSLHIVRRLSPRNYFTLRATFDYLTVNPIPLGYEIEGTVLFSCTILYRVQ